MRKDKREEEDGNYVTYEVAQLLHQQKSFRSLS